MQTLVGETSLSFTPRMLEPILTAKNLLRTGNN